MRFDVYRAGLLALAAGALAHFVVGSATGLSVDEAHYLLYARHLDWSYFDHPPMVGWIQWPWAALDAPTAVLRLVPQLLWLAMAGLLVAAARHTPSGAAALRDNSPADRRRLAGWTMLLFAASPLFHAVALGLLPDTLLSLCVAGLALWMIQSQGPTHTTWRAWLVLGALLGLAGLSKYTAILTALGLLGWLLASGHRPHRAPWAWIALLLAIALVLPVFHWNLARDWLSFRYQGGHVGGQGWSPGAFGRFLLIQLVLVGPALFVGLWLQVRRAARTPLTRLVWLWAIPFLALAMLAGGGRSLPYWTTPAWIALFPLAALGLLQLRSLAARSILLVSLLFQTLIIVWVLASMILGHPAGAGPRPSPLSDLHGWDTAAKQLEDAARQRGTSTIAVLNWTHASRLAWHAPSMAVKPIDDRFDQFDLWFGPMTSNEDALVFVPQGTSPPGNLESGVLHRVDLNSAMWGRFSGCELTEVAKPHLVLYCKDWQWLPSQGPRP
jgi:4-amino-4-deoxy-L-arabinose transferase-like glycosyltransferase